MEFNKMINALMAKINLLLEQARTRDLKNTFAIFGQTEPGGDLCNQRSQRHCYTHNRSY